MESRRLASRTGNACRRDAAAGNPRAVRAAITVLVAGGLLFAMVPGAKAAMYKWTDDRGVIHYSDKMPPDAVNRASVELNRDGTTVRKREQVKPVTQRVPKDESDEQRMRQAERDRVLASRRDRALMESYTNENEIELAKTRAVATIEGQIESADAFIAQMQKRRDELDAKKSTFAPRPVPGEIVREIENIDAEVARQTTFITAKKKEAASVAARYESDKVRFRELRSETGSVVVADETRVASSKGGALQLMNGKP
ncbi:MAG TPA: DUF4124 domain-containing protein [Casimicrobiaceae bacterium]|nr:DUF4124 domain-containing protein [Casimicrobiaceae bacterium]